MRRRQFARSVVVTFSLVELGCTQPPTRNPPPPEIEGGGEGARDSAVADGGAAADGAGADGAAADGAAADGAGQPGKDTAGAADGGAQVEPDGDGGGRIEVKSSFEIVENDDGTCTKFFHVDCPPGVACNPPPPQDVDCPPKELPAPGVVANVHERPDGTCWESFNVKCPPKVMCNPPPPRQVKCPVGKAK